MNKRPRSGSGAPGALLCAGAVWAAAVGAADMNPAHVAPNLAAGLAAMTGGAQTRIVWVQKQFISDDTTRYLECSDSVTIKWLYNGGASTKLVGFDSKDGAGRVLDSSTSTHVKPVIDRSGNFVFWNELANSRSWVMSWDGGIRKTLLSGGEYIVLCTSYDATSGKEYVYTAGYQKYDEYLLTAVNVNRYEFDMTTGSVVSATKTLMWNKSQIMLPFNVASDGIHAGGNMPWPSANIATLPNGALAYVVRGGSSSSTWSCHANIAPDASSRFFHMEETHTSFAVYDQTHANPLWIRLITRLPGADTTKDCNAPRWSNHVSYLTIFSPYTYWEPLGSTVLTHDCTKPVMSTPWREGESGEIYFGKFNDQFNDVQFIRVTDGDWRFRKIQGEAWMSTGEGPATYARELNGHARAGARAIMVTQKDDGIGITVPGREHFRVTIFAVSGHVVREGTAVHGAVFFNRLAAGAYACAVTGQGAAMQRAILVK